MSRCDQLGSMGKRRKKEEGREEKKERKKKKKQKEKEKDSRPVCLPAPLLVATGLATSFLRSFQDSDSFQSLISCSALFHTAVTHSHCGFLPSGQGIID